MSNNFSYLKQYQELSPYLDALKKVLQGEYISNLEEIKKTCIKEYRQKIPWSSKGLDCFPDAQILFKLASEQNTANERQETNSELSLKRKKTLEKVFA